MSIDAIVTLGAYLAGLLAVAVGLSGATSPWWACAVVGSVLIGTVFLSKVGGRKA